MTRRSILSRPNAPELHVVLDEAVLHRKMGSSEIMWAQFDSLIADARRPHVRLQVMPFELGRHGGLDGGFTVLSFEEGVDPDIAYLETPGGDIYLESDHEVRRRGLVFDELSGMALSPDESQARIERATSEITSDG